MKNKQTHLKFSITIVAILMILFTTSFVLAVNKPQNITNTVPNSNLKQRVTTVDYKLTSLYVKRDEGDVIFASAVINGSTQIPDQVGVCISATVRGRTYRKRCGASNQLLMLVHIESKIKYSQSVRVRADINFSSGGSDVNTRNNMLVVELPPYQPEVTKSR